MAETQALQKHSSLNQHPWLVPAFQNKVQHFGWCPTVFPIFARSWGFYTLCCTGRQWGSRQQHQTGFCLKHSCFMVKTLLDAVTCVMINVDWMLQTGFKLHAYFKIKTIRKDRLKLSLYLLPSCQRAFTWWHATLELTELLLLIIRAGALDASPPAVVKKLHLGHSSPCRKNKPQ